MHRISTYQQLNNLKKKNKSLVYFSESLVTSFPIKEIKEKFVSLDQIFKEENIEMIYNPPQDLIDIINTPKLRESAARLLIQSALRLPKGLRFKISEGYRPLWYQKKKFKEIKAELKEKYPRLSEEQLWEEVTKYIADPNLCPPHTTGGAVDVSLVDEEGKEIDMGVSINAISDKSNTFTKKIAQKQTRNRKILFDSLTSVGFVNLPTEWWHYSYGDQYWAIFNNKKYAIYGSVDL